MHIFPPPPQTKASLTFFSFREDVRLFLNVFFLGRIHALNELVSFEAFYLHLRGDSTRVYEKSLQVRTLTVLPLRRRVTHSAKEEGG